MNQSSKLQIIQQINDISATAIQSLKEQSIIQSSLQQIKDLLVQEPEFTADFPQDLHTLLFKVIIEHSFEIQNTLQLLMCTYDEKIYGQLVQQLGHFKFIEQIMEGLLKLTEEDQYRFLVYLVVNLIYNFKQLEVSLAKDVIENENSRFFSEMLLQMYNKPDFYQISQIAHTIAKFIEIDPEYFYSQDFIMLFDISLAGLEEFNENLQYYLEAINSLIQTDRAHKLLDKKVHSLQSILAQIGDESPEIIQYKEQILKQLNKD